MSSVGRVCTQAAWAVAAVVAAGCAANDAGGAAATAGAPYPPNDNGGSGGAAGAGGAGATGGTGGSLPPEQEVESSYESPVATGRFVWVANPSSGRVAFVDAVTLQVKTTEAGNGPEHLAAVPSPDQDVAVVINTLSSSATLLRADATGVIDSVELPVASASNSWAVSKGGTWALAWTDARKVTALSDAEGCQDVTVISTVAGKEAATRLTVGYRPVAVSFADDEKHAYAVTQDGISVLDMEAPGGPAATKLVPISYDLEDPGSRDVAITPDGRFALVRRDGSSHVTVVGIDDGTLTEVELPGEVTDMDVSPDGAHAIAVIRSTGQAAVLPVPGIATDPAHYELVTVSGTVVGSVAMASAANTALLYSNVSDQERVVQLDFGTANPTTRVLKLHAPVLAVFLSSTAASALVLHDPVAGSTDGSAGAFSVMSLSPLLPAKIVSTKARPWAVALTPEGEYGVVAERDDAAKVYGAYLVRSANQQVDRYELASPPIAVGAVTGARRAFVAQQHTEGRITFIDLDTGQARTLTGFELGARVVDGSGM